MGQKIEFNSKGLNILQIGSKIADISDISFDKLKNLPPDTLNYEYQGYHSADHIYSYYFINADSLFIMNSALVNKFFFAADATGTIRGIFLEIESVTDNISEAIGIGFGKAKLASNSSIGNLKTNYKLLWAKDEVRLILTRYYDNQISNISICNTGIDEITPDVSKQKIPKKIFN